MVRDPFVWFEIYLQDMSRARQFREAVLGVSLTKRPAPKRASPESQLEMQSSPINMGVAGAPGAWAKLAGVPSGGMGTPVHFHFEDCAAEESRVEPAEGEFFRPKMSIGQYGFLSLVIDAEGNTIGLHSTEKPRWTWQQKSRPQRSSTSRSASLSS